MEIKMDETNLSKHRLSDRIFYALKLAVDQKDGTVAESLVHALELAMTRNSGGGEFVERRDFPKEVEALLGQAKDLKK
jgi:hypothetical protein